MVTDESEVSIARRTVAATGAVLVEWVRCRFGRRGTPETYSPDRQVLLTRSGRFRWQVGRANQIVDANRAMFVERREVSRDLDAGSGEVTCLLVTPGLRVTRDRKSTRLNSSHSSPSRMPSSA